MDHNELEYKQGKLLAISVVTAVVALMVTLLAGTTLLPQHYVGINGVRCKEACVSQCKIVRSDGFECQSSPKLEGKADLNVNLRSQP